MVAQRLKENLPHFTYLKIMKRPEEWEKWLIRTCQENRWYHVKSPIIWREVGLKCGKKDFVGDINKFLDICYDYYGIPREILSAENFKKEELEWFTERTQTDFLKNVKAEANKRKSYRSRQVCITGASSPTAEVLIMELLETEKQWRENGLEIRLFDEHSKETKLMSSAADAKFCPGPSGLGNCRVTTNIKDALSNVDLVIVLDCFSRKPKETVVKWLKRNRNAMCALGKSLNKYAPPHCRVIIGSPSNQPVCYNATVLASFATKLHVRNIVVVTQDLGRELLRATAMKTKVPLRDFYCPPVWGFVGLNKVVDFSNTLQSHLYKVPGKRPKSTLPQGTEKLELRSSRSFVSEDSTEEIQSRAQISKNNYTPQLGKWPCLAKATAILDLLKIWGLKQEDGNGEVISLGVYSDGTFNIPEGIYWSQPVTLVNGFWVPFKDFPIPRTACINPYYFFLFSIAALYRTKVKPRLWHSSKPVAAQKEVKKFNFDKLIEEVGLPLIRTDQDCVNYLKLLAKRELGIDLDRVDDTIEEEPEEPIVPTEEVRREEIFCECWRQQLKELQKIVFDRSSTTEVEVDLSDVMSGSEWSVINPKDSTVSSSKPVEDSKKIKEEEVGYRKDSEVVSESSGSTVCSCGALESGSICRCLGQKSKEPSNDKLSTEHFYAEQNAEVFEVDVKDAIYADSYLLEKHVTFDGESEKEKETDFKVEFYGKKDAIRDKEADARNQKRIRRYERGGEDSVDEEGDREGLFRKESSTETSEATESSQKDAKFHISVQGVSFEIIGDQDDLEMLDERKRSTCDGDKDSSFREMYTDEIIPSIHIVPPDLGMSGASSSEKDLSVDGGGRSTFASTKEFPGEADAISLASLENDLNEIWGEGGPDLFHKESEVTVEEEPSTVEEEEEEEMKKIRKKQGVSLCCLCRCIIPGGLACCPCGATTVVEVFRKESIEIYIQSEDDVVYNVDYFDLESETTSSVKMIHIPGESSPPVKKLPPESFFPFTPRPENKFFPTPRPYEFTEEYIESLGETEPEISSTCQELMEEAKMRLQTEEKNVREIGEQMEEEEEEEEEQEQVQEEQEQDEEKKVSPSSCEAQDFIKTDFSDLKLFIPFTLEDWKLTVQKKYREWFFQGPQIRDESYYDIAIEEVSEDEYEFDKELEQFFEA